MYFHVKIWRLCSSEYFWKKIEINFIFYSEKNGRIVTLTTVDVYFIYIAKKHGRHIEKMLVRHRFKSLYHSTFGIMNQNEKNFDFELSGHNYLENTKYQ